MIEAGRSRKRVLNEILTIVQISDQPKHSVIKETKHFIWRRFCDTVIIENISPVFIVFALPRLHIILIIFIHWRSAQRRKNDFFLLTTMKSLFTLQFYWCRLSGLLLQETFQLFIEPPYFVEARWFLGQWVRLRIERPGSSDIVPGQDP